MGRTLRTWFVSTQTGVERATTRKWLPRRGLTQLCSLPSRLIALFPFYRGCHPMSRFVLRSTNDEIEDDCPLCGKPTAAPAGTHLCLADTTELVCHDCGRKHAPSLAALVLLACAAERVARIGRHTVFPPLTALLELARAAENYTCVTPGSQRKAG